MISNYKIKQIKKQEAILKRRQRDAIKKGQQYGVDIKGVFGDRGGYDFKGTQIINANKDGFISDEKASQYLKQLNKDVREGVGLFKKTEENGKYTLRPKTDKFQERYDAIKDWEDAINEQRQMKNTDVNKELKTAVEFKKTISDLYTKDEDEFKQGLGKEREKLIDEFLDITQDAQERFLFRENRNIHSKFSQINNLNITKMKTSSFKSRTDRILLDDSYAKFDVVYKEKNYARNFQRGIDSRIQLMIGERTEEINGQIKYFNDYDAIEDKDLRKRVMSIVDYYETMDPHKMSMLYYAGILPDFEEWYTSQDLEELLDSLEAGKEIIDAYESFRTSAQGMEAYNKQIKRYKTKQKNINAKARKAKTATKNTKKALNRF